MLTHAEVQRILPETEAARPMQVMILDDSELDRQRIMRLCDDAGLVYAATEVSTLKEMVSALDAKSFDLVFIDYMLVGEDGLDAVDILSNTTKFNGAAIMIAGEGRVDVAVEAMRRGCMDYLIKSSLTVDNLQRAIATALERRMMSFALEEEREKRHRLEAAVGQYAKTCSVEMRALLAASLRRVRNMRSQANGERLVRELGELEHCIDRLWESLPDLAGTLPTLLPEAKRPILINSSD